VILKKLYTTPIELFKPVIFVEGVNFIFGKKDDPNKPKKSLNGIGKSTFLDLLDFALLASFQKNHSPRLYAAYQKGILKGVSVVLEFEINDTIFAISRSFDDPSNINFSENDEPFSILTIDNCKKKVCDLIFKKDDYEGYFVNTWLRKLLPFYLKIQKPKKERFTDPVQYIKEANQAELNQYHLFLMDINNTYSHENYYLQTQLKKIEDTIRNVKEFISESYDLKEIPDAINKAQNLKLEIEDLNVSIENFKLSKQYEIDENEANLLTAEIKNLWFQNHSDRKKIESYRDSVKNNIEINTKKVERLYKDLNVLLAQTIKKSLDDAISFNRQLIISRKEFIESEIQQLNSLIKKREIAIAEKENARAKIFNFLVSNEAINDLTEAFKTQSEKSKELSDIDSQIKLYQDLSKEQNQLEQEEKQLEGSIMEFTEKIQREELAFPRLFRKIYSSLYPELNDPSIFSVSYNSNSDAKLQINVLPTNEMLSKGRNQGRTLIYDLTVLFNSIEKNINSPRFLVHDGIFDGMDKAHFIALYEFLEEQQLQGKKFQYIMTYNEEGTLTEKFGNSDKVTLEKIEEEAILVLTSKKKLLGDF
jgi:uncharacterized protein YydD (DUF2326 family)